MKSDIVNWENATGGTLINLKGSVGVIWSSGNLTILTPLATLWRARKEQIKPRGPNVLPVCLAEFAGIRHSVFAFLSGNMTDTPLHLVAPGGQRGWTPGLLRSASEVTMWGTSGKREIKQRWGWHPVGLRDFISMTGCSQTERHSANQFSAMDFMVWPNQQSSQR